MDVSAGDRGVDRTRDEDDGQGNAKGNLGHEGPGRQQRGRPDALADEGVDQGTGQRVDDDLDDAEHPDRLDEVLGRVHLVHERELADGEAVREDDVRDSDERVDEAGVLGGPRRPICSHAGVGSPYPRCDDRDPDREDDGREVYITQNGHFGERRGQGQQ